MRFSENGKYALMWRTFPWPWNLLATSHARGMHKVAELDKGKRFLETNYSYSSLVPSRIGLTRGKIRLVTLGTEIGARTTHGMWNCAEIMIAK